MKKLENEVKQNRQYSKDTVLRSEKFADYKDMLSVMLNDKKMYTMEELEEMIKKVTKRSD